MSPLSVKSSYQSITSKVLIPNLMVLQQKKISTTVERRMATVLSLRCLRDIPQSLEVRLIVFHMMEFMTVIRRNGMSIMMRKLAMVMQSLQQLMFCLMSVAQTSVTLIIFTCQKNLQDKQIYRLNHISHIDKVELYSYQSM